jgi:hypothetical protein
LSQQLILHLKAFKIFLQTSITKLGETMKHAYIKRWTVALLAFGLVFWLAACGDDGSRQGSSIEVTEGSNVAIADTATVLPTSTAVPTVVLVEDSPELKEARKHTEEGNFDMAVILLNRVYATHRDAPVVQQQFAQTYLTWGKQLLDDSEGEPSKIVTALDKFTSGLAVAPSSGSERESLQQEADLAQLYISIYNKWGQLQELQGSNAALEQQQAIADPLLGELDRLRELRSDYPGLSGMYSNGLAAIGQIYTAASAQSPNRVALLEQAEQVCGRALEVDPSNAAAATCQQQAKATPTPQPTATKPPAPTPKPVSLAVGKINSDDSPGCISIGVRGHNASGWTLTIDGLRMGASFGGGNARVCGLPGHAVTFTIRNASGNPIPGGAGIPAQGGDIFIANAR